jgi:iron complex outermembrane receptor protein
VKSDLYKGELFGTVSAFGVPHELTFGLSSTDLSQDPIYQTAYTVGSQNLYDPVSLNTVTYGATPSTPTTAGLSATDTGLYALDRVVLSPAWQVIGGLRDSNYRSDQGTDHYDVTRVTPMMAVIYQPRPTLSLYSSFSRGVEQGDTAPTGSANVGQHMAPGVSQQYEIGSRWRSEAGTLASLAFFDITRPGAYTDTSNVYVSDGEQRYRGVELSTQGQLTKQLGWITSAQWLDVQFQHMTDDYNGKLPENTAKRTSSAFLTYDVLAVQGLSLNGGTYYTGRRPVNDLNQAWLSGVTLYAAGARYVRPINGRKWTWQLNVENLMDKEYWAGAGTRLAAGAPRTFKLMVKVDL